MKKHLVLALIFIGLSYTNACGGISSSAGGTCGGTSSNTEGSCCGGSMSMSGCSMGGHDMGSMMMGDSYWRDLETPRFRATGKVRTYYIAADEVLWDYAPEHNINIITGKPYAYNEAEFVHRKEGRIGSKYLKCRYREFTSQTFKYVKARTQHEKHLGFMGPTIRGEVGDTIKIVFLNRCRFPTNIYTSGVFDDNGNHPVPTGETTTYIWEVSERSGPSAHDKSSVFWKYSSSVSLASDFYAGLIGNIAITKRGWAKSDGSPKDVDREIFWMFSVSNENQSPFIDANIKKYVKKPYNLEALKKDSGFSGANYKYGINGYIYGNGPMVTMRVGERVRWYLMSQGGGRDFHTPHWHGNVVLLHGMRMDIASLLPSETIIADMVPDDPGIWLHHCHVNDHLEDGMVTRFAVVE